MKLEKKQEPDIQSTNTFLSNLSFDLPSDYVSFLKEYDGVKVLDGAFFVPDLDQKVLLDILYGVTCPKRFNLLKANEELDGELPDKSIVIGEDPGGAYILLTNDGENNGIYFYDYRHFFDQSDEESNTYFITDTFQNFLDELTE